MIRDRINLTFSVIQVFKKIGLVDKKKYEYYLKVLDEITKHEDLMDKDAKLINRVELSYQNNGNTIRVKIYFKNRKSYTFDLNRGEFVLPKGKKKSLWPIEQSLYLILGDRKRYGIKYKVV